VRLLQATVVPTFLSRVPNSNGPLSIHEIEVSVENLQLVTPYDYTKTNTDALTLTFKQLKIQKAAAQG